MSKSTWELWRGWGRQLSNFVQAELCDFMNIMKIQGRDSGSGEAAASPSSHLNTHNPGTRVRLHEWQQDMAGTRLAVELSTGLREISQIWIAKILKASPDLGPSTPLCYAPADVTVCWWAAGPNLVLMLWYTTNLGGEVSGHQSQPILLQQGRHDHLWQVTIIIFNIMTCLDL